MEDRKKTILEAIIREYIKSGLPVGSGLLVDKYNLGVSPATVRNVMVELEEDGYIRQPHTSAGRIPTENAYKLYVDNLKERKIPDNVKKSLELCFEDVTDEEVSFKRVAKILAELSGNAVFWAFHKNNVYYTGLSNLFQQPEFSQISLVQDVSSVIDRIDEIINEIFEEVDEEARIILGEENPFGSFCSTVIVKYRLKGRSGIFGVLGPMRMDYSKNLALVNFIKSKIFN